MKSNIFVRIKIFMALFLMNYFLCDFQTFRKTTRTSSRRKSQILYWSIFFSQTMKIYPNNNHCCCTLNLRGESIFCNVPTNHHRGPRSDSTWKNCFVSLTMDYHYFENKNDMKYQCYLWRHILKMIHHK